MSLALNDPDRRAAILNSDLEKLTAGRNNGNLVLIKKKNELLTFKKDNHPVYSRSFGNIALEDKEWYKHLGLIFLSNCKWEKQINSIIRKVTLFISCLRSFKYNLCRKALDTATNPLYYHSLITPTLFGITVLEHFRTCSKTCIREL